MEICKNKTVLIITHNTEILPYVDETIDIGLAKKGKYNISSENLIILSGIDISDNTFCGLTQQNFVHNIVHQY